MTRKLSNEAYTPAYVVDPIRKFFGGIDFDPFSCELANRTIKAKEFCSIERSAFVVGNTYLWLTANTIFANPEYSTRELTDSINKIFKHLEEKEVFLLLNSDTATAKYRTKNCQSRQEGVL